MKFYILSAKTASGGYKAGKSVSVYFEADETKVLYGLGGNQAVFENAVRAGIDLSAVDVLVIPAARDSMCGSLRTFLKVNSNARIYGKKSVWDEYFKKSLIGKTPCGLTKLQRACVDRFSAIGDTTALNTSVMMLSTPPVYHTEECYTRFIYDEEDGLLETQDDFSHEIALTVVTDQGSVVLTNSSHSGLRGVLHGAGIWKMTPIAGVIGEVEIFNTHKTDIPLMLRKELSALEYYRNVKLFLEILKPKVFTEVKSAFEHCRNIVAGEVIEF